MFTLEDIRVKVLLYTKREYTKKEEIRHFNKLKRMQMALEREKMFAKQSQGVEVGDLGVTKVRNISDEEEQSFAERLIREYGVATIPVSAFY